MLFSLAPGATAAPGPGPGPGPSPPGTWTAGSERSNRINSATGVG